jgi:hypothetical protein
MAAPGELCEGETACLEERRSGRCEAQGPCSNDPSRVGEKATPALFPRKGTGAGSLLEKGALHMHNYTQKPLLTAYCSPTNNKVTDSELLFFLQKRTVRAKSDPLTKVGDGAAEGS